MKKTTKTIVRAISLTLAAIMIAATFAGCSLKELKWRTTYYSVLKDLDVHADGISYALYNIDDDDNPELIVKYEGTDPTYTYYLFNESADLNDAEVIATRDLSVGLETDVDIFPSDASQAIYVFEYGEMAIEGTMSAFWYDRNENCYNEKVLFSYVGREKSTILFSYLTPFDMHSNFFDIFTMDWPMSYTNNNDNIISAFAH